MKQLLLALFTLTTMFGNGQFKKSISAQLTGNFDLTLKGLATNDAGIGLGCNVSFFATHKLHPLVETNADYFIGDKFLVIDTASGKQAKRASAYSIKAGPQLVITKNILLSATYGIAWYTLRDFTYSTSDVFKCSITALLGVRKHLVTKLFYVNIPKAQPSIQYIGLAAGYRL